MLSSRLLQQAATRHASFYIEKLRVINGLYTEGGAQSQSALTLFDTHWSQIVHAQQWTAQQEDNAEAQRICSQYFKSGQQILYSRLPVSDHIAWLRAGVSAAEQINDTRTMISYMCDLGQAYLVARDVDECVGQYSRALTLAQETGYLPGEAKALIGLGRVKSLSRTQADEAREHLQSAFAISQRTDDALSQGWALQNLAALEERYGDIDLALSQIEQALVIFRSQGDQRYIANALKRTASILERLERYDDALAYLADALVIGRALDDPHLVCTTQLISGLIYTYQHRMDEARHAYQEALDIAEKAGFQSDAALCYVNLGWIHREKGEWDAAEANYRSAQALYAALKYHTRYQMILGNIAFINVLRGDYATAQWQFCQMLTESAASAELQALSLLGLAHLEQINGNWRPLAEALGHLQNSPLRRDYDVDEYWQHAHKTLLASAPHDALDDAKAVGSQRSLGDLIAGLGGTCAG